MRTSIKIIAAFCVVGLFSSGSWAAPVVIAAAIPFSEDGDIASNIREECVVLRTQLSKFIQDAARKQGVEVVEGDAAANTGRVLRVTITNAISSGNAWMGHSKSTSSRGTLLENGVAVASFRASRHSMGGAFAGFKGSCSVLGRTVEAMGQDIGAWLANPVDGAELGDR